ncbi:MAG: homoserine O-succinyltransferase MetX [Oceanicaulis sp.]
MSAAARLDPAQSAPVRDYICGFTRPGGGWLEACGRLTGPEDGPATVVLGGVSAGRRLVEDADGPGWWPGVAAAGGALDPARRRLLSLDFIDAADPFPSLADQAEAVLALAEAAGLERFAIVGASYGGVIALEIAARAPERVRRLDVLCAAAKPNPMATAWRSIQREMVTLAMAAGDPARGVDLARRLAMTTYRTHEEFAQRFADPAPGGRDAAGVEAYLAARGADYAAKTDPQRFLALSASMDSADVAVERITAPARFLAVSSDRLVPPADIEATAARMAAARVKVIDSLYGHDAFLKETAQVNAFLEGAQ